jgi:hypothetical protein
MATHGLGHERHSDCSTPSRLPEWDVEELRGGQVPNWAVTGRRNFEIRNPLELCLISCSLLKIPGQNEM